ncbi:MAG: coproporphyrinogen dehydrogenase HemZ [Oscillospiraceae bacterium]
MKLYLINNDCRYAAEQMLVTLFPTERPEFPQGQLSGEGAELSIFEGEKYFTGVCKLCRNGVNYIGWAKSEKSTAVDELTRSRCLQRLVKLSFYRAALASGVKKPAWGALTGVRPGKLLSNLLEAGLSDRAALTKFCRDNDVSGERAQLALKTAKAGTSCAKALEPRDICLYVGIPFCPTRCSYCSFVSQSTEKSMALIPPFLSALHQEIEATAAVCQELSLRPVSLYMGGGTPTTLSAAELNSLCEKLETAFDLSKLREFTVEAGRPDTITAEKLSVLRAHGVTRVSVNPQTMDDRVLEAIGRKHTARDVLEALDLVRAAGGFEINMDLIAGLPLDSVAGFSKTLKTLLALKPENITIHTLSLKKGSRLLRSETPLPSGEAVSEMLDFANSALTKNGFEPYYLYRQKYMSGGFENIGWQRGQSENIYNICIMEELCSIISMGGGASTKLCSVGGRLEHLYNPKYPHEYIADIDKIISEKQKIKEILKWHTI